MKRGWGRCVGAVMAVALVGCESIETVPGEGAATDQSQPVTFVSPVAQPVRISSPFGPRWGAHHNGVDLAVPTLTAVHAVADGTVTFAGWYGAYGRMIIVTHDDGWTSLYAHLSRLGVREGYRVRQGERIGRSGESGNVTGAHLHFELRREGQPADPVRLVRL